jgi:aryl-alcohol dehydrogenase-like predicted oxidoreductase
MKLILGSAQFGFDYGINNILGKPNVNQVFEILDYAFSQNIRVIDTADAYGDSIKIIGEYHHSRKNNKFHINSKFTILNNGFTDDIDKTLLDLNISNFDSYFFHSFDDYLNNQNIINKLVNLKLKKKIHKIGLSLYDNNQFNQAINDPNIDVIQLPYNLLDNHLQRGKLISYAKSKNKEIQVRSIFLQGLFFKNLDSLPIRLEKLKPYLQKLLDLSIFYSIPMEHLALQYSLSDKNIDNVIIGVDSLMQLKRNILFYDVKIKNELLNAINEINVIETDMLLPYNWN